MGIFHQLACSTLPLIPRPVMRRLAGRYIAGEELGQAISRLEELKQAGFAGVLDMLGEDVRDEREARAALAEYKRGVEALAEKSIDAYVSVKPTHFGLRQKGDLAFELYDELLTHCAKYGQKSRVEMEDHGTTDATLKLFARLRAKHPNVGIVLQSRLFRTPHDIDNLPQGPVDVRMVKGIYLEPESIAHTAADPIREAYIEQCQQLWKAGHFIALASHDDILVRRLMDWAAANGVARDRYEIEVLLGVREPIWQAWLAEGHKVRVYVPYGPDWRAYSQRRLRKNPQMLKAVMLGMFRK
ncbi:MAG: proline dehydrogenase family protein [Planctomycetota bacterium]